MTAENKKVFRVAVYGNSRSSSGFLPESIIPGILEELREELNKGIDIELIAEESSRGELLYGIAEGTGLRAVFLPGIEGGGTGKGRIGQLEELIRLSDMADLVLTFWNENPDGRELMSWELIRRCTEKNIPCIWFSTATGKKYWAENSVFENYDRKLLRQYCGLLISSEADKTVNGRQTFTEKFVLLGNRRYGRFMRRFRGKAASGGTSSDSMTEDGFSFGCEERDIPRRSLLEAYNRHNAEAMSLSERYRGAVYWRTLFPLLAMILLVLGTFSAEIFKLKVFGASQTLISQVTSVMGICFVMHALLNIFTYSLANSGKVSRWHSGYLRRRCTAELLRLYIHLVPYGMQINLNTLFSECGIDREKNSGLYYDVWHELHAFPNCLPQYSREISRDYLRNMREYVLNQIDYHGSSALQYERIVSLLKKREKRWAFFAFAAVTLRGFVQMFVKLDQSPDTAVYGTFANMIALVLPALVSFFTGRIALFGFEAKYRLDVRMKDSLEDALIMLDSLSEKKLSYSVLRTVSDKLSILMLGELSEWNAEISSKKIKPL